jgi:hypothetical protein
LRRRAAAHSPEFTEFSALVVCSARRGAGEVEEETPSSMEASGRRFGATEWLHAGEGQTAPSVVPNSAVQSPVSCAGKRRMKRSRQRTRRRGRWSGAEAGEVRAMAACGSASSGEQSPVRGGANTRGSELAAKLTTTRSSGGGCSRPGSDEAADRRQRHRAELVRRR